MKRLLFLLSITVLLFSCGPGYVQQQPVVVSQPPPMAVQQPVVDPNAGYSPYQVYDNNGSQVVYYTDPYLHTSYYLDYAIFMSFVI